VHLEGIGYFRLTLSAPKEITPTNKHRSALLDINEIDALLVDYFETNQCLTRHRFEQLCDFTPSTAARHLKRLLDEGRLKNTNTKQSLVYEPVKGFYGK